MPNRIEPIALAPASPLFGTLSLSGTSYDFGLPGGSLYQSGTAGIANGANFAGPLSVAPNGLADFAGTLIAGANATASYLPEISLAPNAKLHRYAAE